MIETSTDAEAIAGTATDVTIVPSSLAAKLGVQTANSIPFGAGSTSALSWTSALTDGQIVIGATGMSPAAGSITSTGGSLTVALGTNTIDLSVSGEVAASFPTDSGTATPSANALTVAGGTLLTTSGTGATVTVNADDSVVGSVATDSGTVTPASNSFSIVGVNGITTSGATSVVTIDGSGITGFDWSVETGTTHSLTVNTGVFCNNGAGVTVSLPASAAVGDTFQVVAMDAAGFTIDMQTGQSIRLGDDITTTTTGTIVSSSIGDWVEIVCNVANSGFMANIKQGGEITVT